MTNELVTVMEGKLKLTIGGEEIIAEPGDEIFIPKDALHSVKNISSSATRWLYGYDWKKGLRSILDTGP
jgi:quercetin dioxygenase-like cupin family protein